MEDARSGAGAAGRPSYGELQGLVVRLEARIIAQDARIAEQDALLLAEQQQRIAEQEERIAEQDRVIAELRARLAANSTNSSNPPSSDGYGKPPPKERSLRNPSGRKRGKQKGSRGSHLRRREKPDETTTLPAGCCEGCGEDLADAPVIDSEDRQVLDLPEMPKLRCVAYVAERRRCQCGRESCPVFPDGVSAPVQYGPRVRALGIYLVCYQHLPYLRARELLSDWLAAPVSVGALHAWVARGEKGLEGFLAELKDQLACSEVLNVDETGMRTDGKLSWVHSASTDTLTHLHGHRHRGGQGADHGGILTRFTGTMIHDGWKAYRAYTSATHALCGSHHLRELIAAEQDGQRWAGQMTLMLLDAKDTVQDARQAGHRALDPAVLADQADWYQQVIAAGYAENPSLALPGRRRKTKAQNLLLRLEDQERNVLRFTTDFNVSFDNNLAERDLRMVKIHQKISGCFRTTTGLDNFLAVRSYLSTGRKQLQNPSSLLIALTTGNPWMPPSPAPGTT
jgi:transposase